MNIESWFTALAAENTKVDVWQRQACAGRLLELFSPLAIDQLIAALKKSPATKPIKKQIKAQLLALNKEYMALLNDVKLPLVVINKLQGDDLSTAVALRVLKVIHTQAFPWLVAWKLGFMPRGDGSFRLHQEVSQRMQLHIQNLVEQDALHAKVIYALLSTNNQPDFTTLQRVKQLFVSECAFLDTEKPCWLTWHQLVMQWLLHKGTPDQAKARTEQLYRVFSQISFEKPVAATTPVDLVPLENPKSTFQEYVVQYSLYKIFEQLKIKPSKLVRDKLAEYFTKNDTTRKFALYFAIELATRGRDAVADIKAASIVRDALHKFVHACDLCYSDISFLEDFGKGYFDLFFTSNDSGREFFRKNLLKGTTPIVPVKFKEALEAVENCKDAFTFLDDEKLLVVSRLALLSEPAAIEGIVRKCFSGKKDVTFSLKRFLDECDAVFDTPFLFSFADFVARYNAQDIDLFTTLDPVKRSYLAVHKMAKKQEVDFVTVAAVDEGAFVDAWLFAKKKSEFAKRIVCDVEEILQVVLSNEDRIYFLAHASTFEIFDYNTIIRHDIRDFLGSIEKYRFTALQKALLLYEFFRVGIHPYRLFIDRFEGFLGHKLPSLTAFTILLLHSIPNDLLTIYDSYYDFKRKVRALPDRQLGVPGELVDKIRDVEVTLHQTCYLPVAKCGYIHIDGCYGGTLVNFARPAFCSPSRNPESAVFVHQFFFPDDLITKKLQGSEVVVPQFSELSISYSYVWQVTGSGYLYHLKIRKAEKERSLEVPLAILPSAFEQNPHLAEAIHWIIMMVSEESAGYEITADFENDELEAKTVMTRLVTILQEARAELTQYNQRQGLDRLHQLHLPWDDAMWQHVCSAYIFARNLRVGVRKILSSEW
jgi:hypothetical protein